jgi:hypothetical protein
MMGGWGDHPALLAARLAFSSTKIFFYYVKVTIVPATAFAAEHHLEQLA